MSAVENETADRSITDLTRSLVEENSVELPPLPELAMRLRELLAKEDVDARQVATLLGTDPAIASTLLRRANSATFGGLCEITEIGHAIARLGLKEVEALVTTVALKGAFEVSDPHKQDYLRMLWDHSLMVGLASRRLAVRGNHEAETAFLAGLLHDIGRLVVLKSIDDLQRAGKVEITSAVLEELMEVLHCELGHRALVAWNLPEELCNVVKDHENDLEDASDYLLAVVQAGDAIACKLGFHPAPDPDLVLLEEPAVEILGLEDVELAMLMVDLEDDFRALRAML